MAAPPGQFIGLQAFNALKEIISGFGIQKLRSKEPFGETIALDLN